MYLIAINSGCYYTACDNLCNKLLIFIRRWKIVLIHQLKTLSWMQYDRLDNRYVADYIFYCYYTRYCRIFYFVKCIVIVPITIHVRFML